MTVLHAATLHCEEICIDVGVVCFSSSLESKKTTVTTVVVVAGCEGHLYFTGEHHDGYR